MGNDGCAKVLVVAVIVLVVFALAAGAMVTFNKSVTAKTNAEANAYVRTAAADVDNLIRRQQAAIDNMYERLLLAENTAIALMAVEEIGTNSRAAAENSYWVLVLMPISLGIVLLCLGGLMIHSNKQLTQRMVVLEEKLDGQDAAEEG